jgi:hypothetical protein
MIKLKDHKNRNKKILYICSGLILLLLVAAVLEKTNVTKFVTLNKPTNSPIIDTGAPTQTEKKNEDSVNATNKENLIKQEAAPPTTVPVTTSQNIIISAKQEENSTVTVFTKLYGYSSGNCTLTVNNESASTNQSAKVIYQPEFSGCAGFSVPIASVGPGNWSIILKVDSDGALTTQNINFKAI